jgi:hypothetical protein
LPTLGVTIGNERQWHPVRQAPASAAPPGRSSFPLHKLETVYRRLVEQLSTWIVSKLFADLRAVIVDEVHAFAGGDRGWHLPAVLERLSRIAGRPLQRLGLSARLAALGNS